jgi:Na+-translocating ferredoxin:NAD+ oxidoreductase RnfG subunit
MMHNRYILLPVIAIAGLFLGFGLPQKLQKKVVREVEKTFETSGVDFTAITVPETLANELEVKITGDNLFRLGKEGELLGYAFIGEAPSKTAMFDYLVIFDRELKVLQAKVLVYREEYGGEIGSHRWLRQFEGMTGQDRASTETNIDAISGATISVRSMTRSMDMLLQTIGKLQQQKVI